MSSLGCGDVGLGLEFSIWAVRAGVVVQVLGLGNRGLECSTTTLVYNFPLTVRALRVLFELATIKVVIVTVTAPV